MTRQRTTTNSDAAAEAAIDAACRSLHLPSVREQAAPLAEAATRTNVSHRGYLADLLACEVDDRAERRRRRRISEAHFPRLKHLADFDYTHSPVEAATIATLAKGDWITAGEPAVFVGDSGTGKTHLLIGLALAACEQGRRVRYTTCAAIANQLAEAATEHTLTRTVGRWGRYELVCIDEIGYVHLDPSGAELIFQILTEREERASVAVATNLPFSEWGNVFTDARLAAAVVDRITYKAHLIETGTQSYRLRTSQGAAKPKNHN